MGCYHGDTHPALVGVGKARGRGGGRGMADSPSWGWQGDGQGGLVTIVTVAGSAVIRGMDHGCQCGNHGDARWWCGDHGDVDGGVVTMVTGRWCG